ncbi:MAG: hypothetical protein ACRBBT_03165 [Paracoccaceae bacterium]
MTDLIDHYFEARGHYSDEHFEKFFEIAGMPEPVKQMIAKDMVIGAASYYLSELAIQEEKLTRGELLKAIKRASRASHELTTSLSDIFKSGPKASELTQHVLARREEIAAQFGTQSDTYQVLAAIFPFDKSGHGFRQTGLTNALELIHGAIEEIDTQQIARTRRNKIAPLTNWAANLCLFWFLTKGEFPTTGHYEKEFAARGSIPVDAMLHMITQIDPDISEHLMADAINAAMRQIAEEPANVFLTHMVTVNAILSSAATYAPKRYWHMFLELPGGKGSVPQDQFDALWGSAARQPETNGEQAYVSKEQFAEMTYSTEEGNNFLRLMMDLGVK